MVSSLEDDNDENIAADKNLNYKELNETYGKKKGCCRTTSFE